MNKVFWGLFFILSAIFVIVNQLGYYTDLSLLTLLLTIFIIPITIKSIMKVNFPGILFSLAFLGIIYSTQLGIESLTPWPILIAALLGSIGLSIIFSKKHYYKTKLGNDKYDQVINGEDLEEVNLNINFGSSIKYVNSDDFKVANLRCSFGDIKVYFDNAKIVGDSAIINVDLSLSGLALFIPNDWKIINKVDVTLGGIEEANAAGAKTTKTIILQGKINLAGIEIIYI